MTTLLTADHLSLTRADRLILDDVSLTVTAGDRLALLGRNGAGKTTLLRTLAHEETPDDGTVWRAPDTRLAVLPQQPVYPPGVAVHALVDAAYPYGPLEAHVRALEQRLAHGDDVLAEYSAAQARLDFVGAYTWPARAARTLGILDLAAYHDREAATLSGGERTRLALALTLLQEADLLLLDEPTNHLDIRMREWLESWLATHRGAALFTSHDRTFLDRAAHRSLYLEGGVATAYPGGFTRARAQRQLEQRTRERAHRIQAREHARLEGSAERLDEWGRRSTALRGRLARMDVPDAPQAEKAIRMRLLAGQARARVVLWADHLHKSYGERAILRDASLKVRHGDRIALMGANGTGKTTLLRLLSGETYPDNDDAVLRVADGVHVATLDQTWHGLDPDAPLRRQFEDRFGPRANALLGRAGFTGAHWPLTPRQLSGGERARAGLALVSALRADLLLLDEPTNHLDVETLEALEAAVNAYGGAVIVVTHDRAFARNVATRLWVIEDARLIEREGWGKRTELDPARTLDGDPPPPPPPPTARQRVRTLESKLADIARALDTHPGPTGREEARLRARQHRLRQDLYTAYGDAYAAPQWDLRTREGALTIHATLFGAGAMFHAARDPDCPHLAWDGATLRWSTPPPAWYGAALLGGALRLLFERLGVTRATLGDGGPTLTRRAYFERSGYVRHP
ncbi:ABC-F family ATP-binding cassette domain-containing protein [Deinococcus maricopensis]|uniref:ABC transporter related protein n=1 Tax=Deinococcus maricopensis (strain DSM 21211 / LMG 22137 / NRRL B-23946 / LB-34) TaxID=709986 RepID=E8U9A4_DEIML|nr:ABC-F family ATP-binding cassette domain-containing protein [Deinococcus maricopensis]ADV67643.1 ABC transporter related protein [Deinococcus maricopensis DSM 21211]